MKQSKIVMAVLGGMGITLVIAALSILAYSTYQGYAFEYANHKAMVQIIQYNLQQGNLKPVPPPQVLPPAPPAAEPKK